MTLRQKLAAALMLVTTLGLVACAHRLPSTDPLQAPTQVTTSPAPDPDPVPALPALPDPGDAGADAAAAPDAPEAPAGFHKAKWQKHLVLTLTLRGPINEDAAKAITQVIDQVEAAAHDPQQDPIEAVVFVMDTPGGLVSQGEIIGEKLQELDIPLVCVVDGDGISMGYMLLQDVCPVRLMTDRSDLMIHEVRLGGEVSIPGSRGEAQQFAEMMRAMNDGLQTIVAKRMGLTLEQLYAHIRNSAWWMNPDEALANHAVDAVVHNMHSQVIKPLEDNLQLPAGLPQVTQPVQLEGPKPLRPARRTHGGHRGQSSHR